MSIKLENNEWELSSLLSPLSFTHHLPSHTRSLLTTVMEPSVSHPHPHSDPSISWDTDWDWSFHLGIFVLAYTSWQPRHSQTLWSPVVTRYNHYLWGLLLSPFSIVASPHSLACPLSLGWRFLKDSLDSSPVSTFAARDGTSTALQIQFWCHQESRPEGKYWSHWQASGGPDQAPVSGERLISPLFASVLPQVRMRVTE